MFVHILTFLLKTYSRICENDVTGKMMAREKCNVKLHIRKKMASLSDVSTYAKNEKQDVPNKILESNEHIELIKFLEKEEEYDDENELNDENKLN